MYVIREVRSEGGNLLIASTLDFSPSRLPVDLRQDLVEFGISQECLIQRARFPKLWVGLLDPFLRIGSELACGVTKPLQSLFTCRPLRVQTGCLLGFGFGLPDEALPFGLLPDREA
jgi:hypothetical protein